MNFKAIIVGVFSVWGIFGFTLPVVNLVVDPFQYFHSIHIPYLNELRNVAGSTGRQSKALRICRVKPDFLILGSSRAEFIFDPSSEFVATRFRAPYNAAVAGTGPSEIFEHIVHAYEGSGTKNFLIALDFHMFNAYREDVIFRDIIGDLNRQYLVGRSGRKCDEIFANFSTRSLFHLDSFDKSLDTIKYNLSPPRGMTGIYKSNGQRDSNFMIVELLQHPTNAQAPSFRGQVVTYLEHVYFPKPEHRNCLVSPNSSAMQTTKDILDYGAEHGLNYKFVLTPEHITMQLALEKAGLLDNYRRWKSRLVDLVNEANSAASASDPEVELWDFALVNSVTAEARPPLVPSSQKSMNYWFEATHSQPIVGEMIVSEVLGGRPLLQDGGDIGLRIDGSDFDDGWLKYTDALSEYKRKNPDEVDIVDKWVRQSPVSQYESPDSYCTDNTVDAFVPEENQIKPSQLNLRRAAELQRIADAAMRSRRLDVAIALYSEAIELSIPNTALHYSRGLAYLESHEYKKAEVDFKIGLQLEPQNSSLLFLLQQAQSKLNE
ncbi:hypothetical protein OAQ35_04000 [Litorivicinus sp.]|nr:hypothetical protein [Litorivicinus sp.]